jgi:hypothetical protein
MPPMPSDEVDDKIRDWMRRHGWAVTKAGYDSGAYAWSHDVKGPLSPTLRISQSVLEDYPAVAILELLDRLNVAAAIRVCPDCRLVVVQQGSRVTLEEVPEPA